MNAVLLKQADKCRVPLPLLQVIGDKHGPKSAKLLSDETGRKIMTEIQDKLKVSIRLIHVVRNPYDNVATMAIRASNGRQFIEQVVDINMLVPTLSLTCLS